MVRVTTSGITLAEKEKCIAAVKKRDPDAAVAMETCEEVKPDGSTHSVASSIIDLTEDEGICPQVTVSTTMVASNVGYPASMSVKASTQFASATQSSSQPGSGAGVMGVMGDASHMKMEVKPDPDAPVAMETMTIAPAAASSTDVTKPLTIETKFPSTVYLACCCLYIINTFSNLFYTLTSLC